MKRRTLMVATLFLVLAGCATTGKEYSEMQSSVSPLKQGEGRVYFYRESSMVGAAVQPEIRLNGDDVGTSTPGGFFFVDRPAGSYQAHAATEVDRMISFTLADGETKYIRTSPTLGVIVGHVEFTLVDQAQAKKEMAELHYTGD